MTFTKLESDRIVNYLKLLCEEAQISLSVNTNGHVQIFGKLLVNYYPYSKNKTAYVSGTKEGIKNCSAKQAFDMAFKAPDVVEDPVKRKCKSRKEREKLLKVHPYCLWCGNELNIENSTLEHIIPLKRGGLDNANNRGLACRLCNEIRGMNMPELTTE